MKTKIPIYNCKIGSARIYMCLYILHMFSLSNSMKLKQIIMKIKRHTLNTLMVFMEYKSVGVFQEKI